MNINKWIYLPQLAQNKLLWFIERKKLNQIGNNCSVQKGFDIKGEKYISIGNNFCAGERIRLYALDYYNNQKFTPHIVIGNDVCITEGGYISSIDSITIGDGTLLGPNVFITDNFHGNSTSDEMKIPPLERNLYSKGKVTIGKNVWIGRNACIMPGVIIGDGAVIGANSVVTHNIPAYSIAIGAPSKVIREN